MLRNDVNSTLFDSSSCPLRFNRSTVTMCAFQRCTRCSVGAAGLIYF